MLPLVLSITGAIIAIIGLTPLLGILNYFAILLLVIALIISLVKLSSAESRGKFIASIIISGVMLLVAIVRLIMGGGIL